MTGSGRIVRRIPLLRGLALLGFLPLAAQADPPFGSAEWVRAQESARAAAAAQAPPEPPVAPPADRDAQAPATGEGMAVQPPVPDEARGPEPESEGAPDGAAPPDSVNPLSRMALGALEAFKGRPLFAPARRPPYVEPTVAEAPPPPPEPPVMESPAPDLRLVGIVAGIDRAVAILGRPTGEPPVSVRVGDAVEAWRVHLIAPDRVVLRQGEREQAYRLFSGASAAVRRPAPPHAPAAALPHLPGRAATAEP